MRLSTVLFSALVAYATLLHLFPDPPATTGNEPVFGPQLAPADDDRRKLLVFPSMAPPVPFLEHPRIKVAVVWFKNAPHIELIPPPLEAVFEECRDADPCVIKRSLGGNIWAFQSAAKRVLSGERSLVVIDGLCASACAIFADAARKRVCITRRADFQFHKAYSYDYITVAGKTERVVDKYFDPPHHPAIAKWAARQGGFPEKGMLKMPYADAARFWRTCELDPPLPQPRPGLAKKHKSRRY